MRVDQTRQNRRLAQINHVRAGWNFDARFGADIGDAVAHDEDDLLRQHLARLAVEQTAGPNRGHPGRNGALVVSDVRRTHTRLRSYTSPGSLEKEQ